MVSPMHGEPVDDTAVVAAARSLRPLILSSRHETESARCLAPAVVAALIEKNLFRLAVPLSDGGLEASPLEALRVYEELAGAEAAAAWIVWNNTLPALMSRFLAADVRHALFAGPRTVTANSTRPSGHAVRCEGGFRVTGQWALVSGCELAEHLLLRCVVPPVADPPGPRPPELIMAYVPKQSCRIVDTWHAGGLRGTGSHDVVIQDEFVPAANSVAFTQPPQLGSALYRMPFAATLAAGCAAICLGIAQTAIQTLIDLAMAKVSPDTGAALRDRPVLQIEIARLQTRQAAARLLLHSAVEAAWRACCTEQPITLKSRAAIWGAAQHASSTAKDVVRRAYDAAGATALYVDCLLERAHRDIHAVTQHIILNESWLQEAGRVWLDLEPTNAMFAS
jgi:indole-3-acetate monooxygenase